MTTTKKPQQRGSKPRERNKPPITSMTPEAELKRLMRQLKPEEREALPKLADLAGLKGYDLMRPHDEFVAILQDRGIKPEAPHKGLPVYGTTKPGPDSSFVFTECAIEHIQCPPALKGLGSLGVQGW